MQDVSKKWTTLLSDQQCTKEIKVEINGHTYTHADIVGPPEVTGSLYPEDTVSVGGTCAREIDITLRNPGEIPRAALMALSVRLVTPNDASEWKPKGFFRVDTREADNTQHTLAIHGFDRMLEAEQPYKVPARATWPRRMDLVVGDILAQLGWELDDRTVITTKYTMEMPVNGETCREMLGWVAAASGGNWTITDEGKARLIRLRDAPETALLVEEYGRFIQFGNTLIRIGDMEEDLNVDNIKDTTYIGNRANQITVQLRHKPITQVVLTVSDEAGWIVGDETGDSIDVYCPDGTEQMARDLLEYLGGYEYQPVQATDAMIDPAVELGDGATIENVFAIVASMDVTMDALYSADIGAPGQHETESEYGSFEGPTTKKLERQGDALRVQITKTEESLTTKITDGLGDLSSTLEQTASGLRNEIKGVGDRTTVIETTIDGITVSGEGGTTYIKPGAIQANSITGSMIAADTITADNIQAGSIGTDELNSKYLNIGNGKFVVDNGNITIQNCNITLKDYSITGKNLKDDAVDTRTIANDAVKSDQIYSSAVTEGKIATDAVTSDKIMAGAVIAEKINARGLKIGPSDNDIEFEVTQDGHVIIGGDVTMKSGVIKWADIDGSTTVESDIRDAKQDAGEAKTAADGAVDDVIALAKGEYTKAGDTFISKNNIYSPNISGGAICGAMYYDENRQGYMDISNTRPGWFEFGNGGEKRNGGRFLLNIGDSYITLMNGSTEGTSMVLRMYDGGLSTARTLAYGAWDFSGANVTGLTAKFG